MSRFIRPLPDLQLLEESFTPDFEAGTLTWKTRPLSHFNNEADWIRWNKLHAGHIAGWIESTNGYHALRLCNTMYRVHKILWKMYHKIEPSMFIDHADRNRQNNAITNLRPATSSENNRNATIQVNNQSGVTGVYWYAKTGRWIACIKAGDIRRSRSFKDKADAVACRQILQQQYHGEFIGE